MSDLQDALAQIKARAENATEGPWEVLKERVVTEDMDLITPRLHWAPDAEFIAHARTDVPRLVEAIEAVMQECYRVLPNDPQGDAILNGIELSVSDKLTGGEPS